MLGRGAQLYLVLEQHFQSPGGLGRGHWPLPRSRALEPQCTHTQTHTHDSEAVSVSSQRWSPRPSLEATVYPGSVPCF